MKRINVFSMKNPSIKLSGNEFDASLTTTDEIDAMENDLVTRFCKLYQHEPADVDVEVLDA